VVWPYSTSLFVMVPPVSQRPDDAEFRSIGNANAELFSSIKSMA
jgi:hypothetical protein